MDLLFQHGKEWYPLHESFNALTSQELGEVIIQECAGFEYEYIHGAHRFFSRFFTEAWMSFAGTEAQARAEFLIYLLESRG